MTMERRLNNKLAPGEKTTIAPGEKVDLELPADAVLEAAINRGAHIDTVNESAESLGDGRFRQLFHVRIDGQPYRTFEVRYTATPPEPWWKRVFR